MEQILGTSNRVLDVDLSTKTVETIRVSDKDRKLYLGGKGLALKYLYERFVPGSDPLGESNTLAVMTGVLMGTGAPCSGRFAAVTKSPLTGILTASSCGGPFGMALKTAGYDGVLIRGRSEQPVYLVIESSGARFADAASLWGLDTVQTQEKLDLGKHDGALVIGPAGENKVLYANIASGHRFLGRGGMGAVMGAKCLKAVVALGGTHEIQPRNPSQFKKATQRATRYINANQFTGTTYRKFGTAANVMLCNQGGILPVENFRGGRDDRAEAVSGESMRQRYNSRPSTCKPCTILCGHKGTHADETTHQIPEYETVGLLGTNLGIFDPDRISQFNDLCNQLGMDTISAGATLAWTMEAGEKGLLETPLAFGRVEGIPEALADIALRRDVGDELANGTRWLAEKYGGKDFAIHVKGLEMAAYDPRGSWGQGLAFAVANRGGCHLSATVFPLEVFFGLLNPLTTRAKARFVCFFERLYASVNSLHTCLFTAFAYLLEPPVAKYTPKALLGLSMQYLPVIALGLMDVSVFSRLYVSVTGIRLSPGQLLTAGDRIHTLERYMNTLEGITRRDDILPERFLKEGRRCDPKGATVPLEEMLDVYYRLRGYSPNGVPTQKTLKKYGIVPKNSDLAAANGDRYREWSAGRHWLKRVYLSILLWFVGRAIQAASGFDDEVKKDVARLPDGFIFSLGVGNQGPMMIVGKTGKQGRLRYLGAAVRGKTVDLAIRIKSIDAAFRMFTFQESTAAATCRNRLTVDGPLEAACAVIRIFDVVEIYLLPKILARLAVKRYPKWPIYRKTVGRARLYIRTLVGV